MKVRAGLLLRVALGAALAVVVGAGAGGAATPGQDEMNVVDQPGYQPTPEEEQLTGAYEKQEVFFRTTEAPGTIIIDTKDRFLYLVQGNNRALRYGIGVGRDGFTWSGLQKISRKQEWPDWRPPPEMIERQPYLPRFMAGGPGNPLGARAMYLGATVYRIHGTNQPQTIGHAVSSGCFRLVNDDVIDLYEPRAGRHQGDHQAGGRSLRSGAERPTETEARLVHAQDDPDCPRPRGGAGVQRRRPSPRRSRPSRTGARSSAASTRASRASRARTPTASGRASTSISAARVAAAIFNDPSKVQFVPLSASDRFDALKNKQIDVLSRNSTWTMGREGDYGVVFAGVTYYDGQAFLVPKSRNLQSALELDGSKVCVQPGTTTEPNFIDFFEANHMKYETVHEASADEMIAAYEAGQCDVLTTDESGLFAMRLQLREAERQHDPARHHLEGAARSRRQAGRHAVVQYRQMGQFRHAQRRGARRQLEDDRRRAEVAEARRQAAGRNGGRFRQAVRPYQRLGRARHPRRSAITREVFDRNVGAHSKLGIPRGLNELWNNGGIQYAPPIR